MRDENRRSCQSPAVPFAFLMLRRTAPEEWTPPCLCPLRHLHGHCVVCYTVEGWFVFIMVISVGTEGTVFITSRRFLEKWQNKTYLLTSHKKSPAISTPHRGLRSTLEAPETLGICRLAVADSFKAADGTLPRVRGMWRPARLVAVGTLRQMLLPMRTWVLEGVELLVVPQPRIPRAAVVWALGVEESEDGTTVAGEGEVELEEGCRKVGAAEVIVFVDWLTWWRVVGVLARWRPL